MNMVLYCTAWGLQKTLKDLYFSPGTVKVKIQVFWMREFVSEQAVPDILKDCSHTEKSNKMQQCIKVYYSIFI
jgi:hypothetical protein